MGRESKGMQAAKRTMVIFARTVPIVFGVLALVGLCQSNN